MEPVSKGGVTRQAVLDAGLDLASTAGLGGLTIGALADHVGMSKSGLFAHFQSKEALQIAILEAAIARFTRVVFVPALQARRGEPRLRTLFDRWMGWGHELPGGCVFLAASIELDDKPGPVRDVLEASQRDWLASWVTAVRLAVDEGHLRADLDVDQLAHQIVVLGYGHNVLARLLRAGDAEARTRAAFEQLLEAARPR